MLELGGLRLLTDPAFDPAGNTYEMGPWFLPGSWFSSEKTYEIDVDQVAIPIDAVLASHDQHADNLDHQGREFLLRDDVKSVITTVPGATRLRQPLTRDAQGRSLPLGGLDIAAKLTGLRWGESMTLAHGRDRARITATPAKHGPSGTPHVTEVNGFVVELEGFPTVWFSGDTVWFDGLDAFLQAWTGAIDIAVLHCGGVAFPDVPVLGAERYTLHAADAVRVAEVLNPAAVVPIHYTGWTHFRESVDELKATFAASSMADRVQWLALGEPYVFDVPT